MFITVKSSYIFENIYQRLTFENLFTALFFPLPCLLYNFDFIEMTFGNIDFTLIANKNGLSWRK